MHATAVSAKKPDVKRRPHRKVRSGCLTCKIRRVKCDELRPFCARCIKFGIRCDGYASPKVAKGVPPTRANILPKHPYSIPLYKGPALMRFEDEDESRYFEVFSTNTAYEIFPNIEMGRLRTIFLQACDAKKFIRQAAIALGALDVTSQASRPPSHTRYAARSNFNNPPNRHYQYALKEYAHAIKCAQMDGENDFRTALMTSLVILSFEGWLGNHEVAVQQIRLGTRLLKEWKERRREKSAPGSSLLAASDDENVLSHVFTRLSIQLRSATLPLPSVSSELPPLRIDDPEKSERMPESFSDLTEAGKFYGNIVRFAVTFVAQGLPRIAGASSLTGAYQVGVATGNQIPDDVAKAQATLTKSLHRWMKAFAWLRSNRKFQTLAEKKASITLELQMKATYMGAIKSLAQDELVFDAYHDIYRDIVNLSEALLNCSNTSRVPKFCFDSGVVIPLWFTGHKCRDPILRRKVISLLLSYPRREGVWDSVFAGLVIECLRAFEEEYMKDGEVPGWARIRNTSFDVDLKKRVVEVKCQQRMSATSDEVVLRRRTVDYYVHTGVTLEQVGAVIA
ncbi:uncharacterized protein LY89DRAFT_782423 [Mollisia scopiformis]|uniref:Zn(2)-C6 fungal-type domain-containing protein n=1 Tax=Mollisia scopiformis TaxID=149040 RepID=A0A194X7H5_MOLSC|nr:uncharacterized protein LY89DRAFT_782423 [Mollisia scopiformis]KUJ16116.1 hypothetical protein LY89DRAFT_782423 [Mollisia scopiformis]